MEFHLSRKARTNHWDGSPTNPLTALQQLDETIVAIANGSPTPSGFGWSLKPVKKAKGLLELRIWIGDSINPNDVKDNPAPFTGKELEPYENKVLDHYQGRYKPWKIRFLLSDDDTLSRQIRDIVELFDAISSRFNPGTTWDSLRDEEEIKQILAEWY